MGGCPDSELLDSKLFSSGVLGSEVFPAKSSESWIFSSGVFSSELVAGCGKWIGDSWLRIPGLLLQLRLNRRSSASLSCNTTHYQMRGETPPELLVSLRSPSNVFVRWSLESKASLSEEVEDRRSHTASSASRCPARYKDINYQDDCPAKKKMSCENISILSRH